MKNLNFTFVLILIVLTSCSNEDDKNIGHVTSGIFSPTLNKPIGLAIVDIDYSSLGEHIYILIRNKKILAKNVSLPFYKAND